MSDLFSDAPFTLVQLEQGTARWRDWRQGGIGASDAPAVMGENPWKSRARLLKEKTSPREVDFQNAAMARGNQLEPIARGHFMDATNIMVQPACLQSDQHPWLRASVDGICLDTNRVLEIKCGTKVYELTEKHDAVPRYYVGQLQHILAITGYASIDFCCWLPGQKMLHLHVPRDEDYIARMLERHALFWQELTDARLTP